MSLIRQDKSDVGNNITSVEFLFCVRRSLLFAVGVVHQDFPLYLPFQKKKFGFFLQFSFRDRVSGHYFGVNGLDVFVFDDFTLISFFQRTSIMDCFFFSRLYGLQSRSLSKTSHNFHVRIYYVLVCTTFFFASGFSHFYVIRT